MSFLGKKWVIKNKSLSESNFLQDIFKNRKPLDEVTQFHDPMSFTDMEKTLERIGRAIENKERIIIFGDYDVDGITATAILIHTLNALNATVSYRIPHRQEDGYGLSEKFIDEFIEKEIKLVITVDCGISCYKEVEKAQKNGVDVVVTDHHTIPAKPPEAFSIIHPKFDNSYPYDELTGAGVALKLAQALIKKFAPEKKELANQLIEFAALGTVADLGPLTNENRLIVQQGLQNLSSTPWLGIREIMSRASIDPNELSSYSIGFQIGPRINAAGRIGNPYIALSLLLQDEKNEKIGQLGHKLEQLNDERRTMTTQAVGEAIGFFGTVGNPSVLIAEHPNWHVGILGLVAGRIADKFSKPTIIFQDFGDHLVGSARSPEHFNIIEAITASGQYLESFGGHAQAAGLTIKKSNMAAFKQSIQKFTTKKVGNKTPLPTLNLDCPLPPHKISLELLDQISQFAPFGVGNPRPTFIIKNVEPHFPQAIGKQRNHLKFSIQNNGQEIEVIAFNMGHLLDETRRHRRIDIACELDKNTFRNRTKVQLKALDFRKAEE